MRSVMPALEILGPRCRSDESAIMALDIFTDLQIAAQRLGVQRRAAFGASAGTTGWAATGMQLTLQQVLATMPDEDSPGHEGASQEERDPDGGHSVDLCARCWVDHVA